MSKIWIYVTMVVLFLTGCEEYMDVQFDNDTASKLVVEGAITTDTTSHTIVLSRSGDFFDKGDQVMETGAAVSITDGSSVYILSEVEPGIYQTDLNVFGTVGKTYTLTITLDNGEVYSATETIAALPDIDSVVAVSRAGFDPDAGQRTQGYYINYYGPEPEGLGDYYQWDLYIDGKLESDSIHEKVFTDDEFVDGNYIQDFEIFFIKESDLPADTAEILIEMFSISRAYYEYLIGLMLETVWKGSPWDGPPSNAVSNISNDALGYFRASDRKTATTRIIRQPQTK